MKDYKIGKIKVKLCESIEDLNIRRHVAVKQQMIMLETGMDIPSLKETFIRMKNEFDKNSSSGMLIAVHEFIVGLKHTENMDDADQMIFALITLEEGENHSAIDKTELMAKLQRFANAGLTQGQVKKEVGNFLNGSIFK